jgi:hypothetical protein
LVDPNLPVPRLLAKLRNSAFLSYILMIAHVLTWLKFSRSSFWLDECGTVWLTQGGFTDVYRRSLLFLQAPLYGLIATAAAQIPGQAEWALRLPSWIATIFAIYLFRRLANELLGPAGSLPALAIFITWPIVHYVAGDARPYAFALASISGAYLFFLRAARSGRFGDFAVFSLFAALMIHFQLLFVYVLVVPALFLLLVDRAPLYQYWNRWLAALSGVILLTLPLFHHFLSLFSWNKGKSFAPTPEWKDLLESLASPRPLLFFLGAVILALPFIHRYRIYPTRSERIGLYFALIAGIVPVGLLFAVSTLSATSLFVPRYLIPAVPGIALIWGWLLSRLDPPHIRFGISAVALAAILATQWSIEDWRHDRDDWRAIVKRANSLSADGQNGLVIYTSFIETGAIDPILRPEHREYILSPLAAYPAASPHIVILPLIRDATTQNYWNSEFEQKLRARKSFTVILRGQMFYLDWTSYLISFAHARGLRLVNQEFFGRDPKMILLHFQVPSSDRQ